MAWESSSRSHRRLQDTGNDAVWDRRAGSGLSAKRARRALFNAGVLLGVINTRLQKISSDAC